MQLDLRIYAQPLGFEELCNKFDEAHFQNLKLLPFTLAAKREKLWLENVQSAKWEFNTEDFMYSHSICRLD